MFSRLIKNIHRFHKAGSWERRRRYPRQTKHLPFNRAFLIVIIMFSWASPLGAEVCPPDQGSIPPRVPNIQYATNPNPMKGDIEIPMPCGAKLLLRPVCVPSDGYLGDAQIQLGCRDCGRRNQGFMETKREASLSGPFTLYDLPAEWRMRIQELNSDGGVRCRESDGEKPRAFYFFIGKYEVTNFQWRIIMDGRCPDQNEPLTADDARPVTGISWYDAVEFTRRYTQWLLDYNPDAIPRFSRGRTSFLRMPNEAEWEYSARGGHLVNADELNRSEFFPFNRQSIEEYAVFTELEASRPPERLAWIGTRCSNPLGLFDTAGNASEMVLEPFSFSIGSRLHGAAGGLIVKGGSYRKGKNEIMPGRREEMPLFLPEGPFRSNDLGFRVALSAIVTPDGRHRTLTQQWKALGPSSAPGFFEIDQRKDVITEIDRLIDASRTVTEKNNLIYLREFISGERAALEEKRGEALKEVIWNALYSAEAILNYSIRRDTILDDLDDLERKGAETLPESVLESLSSDIAKAKGTINIFDEAIDYFVRSYIDRVKQCQHYPEDIFDSQLDRVANDLRNEVSLGYSLRTRLDQFKRHVAMSRNTEEEISHSQVLEDLVSITAR